MCYVLSRFFPELWTVGPISGSGDMTSQMDGRENGRENFWKNNIAFKLLFLFVVHSFLPAWAIVMFLCRMDNETNKTYKASHMARSTKTSHCLFDIFIGSDLCL